MGLQWDLQGCCGREEKFFLGFYVAYYVLVFVLWRSEVLKPLKLLAVFVHEMGHASAAWLTCGKVKGIKVYANESGLAGYSGGLRAFVIPGGYVGGAFWGGAFVALSGNRIGATVAACILSAALIIALAHDPNKIVVYISLGFSALTILIIILEWFVLENILIFYTLFFGVFLGFYACRDIWDDTVSRTTDGSDAVVCTETFPCCGPPKCVGIQFLIMAVLFQIAGFYFALAWLVSSED